MDNKSKNVTITTMCPLGCGYHNCVLSVEVSDGVLRKIRPYAFPNRADRGVCPKGLALAEMVHHPDRLQHPLKRVGERGEGKWQRVSWDEALDSIAAKLKDIAQRHGSTSIVWENPAGFGATLQDITPRHGPNSIDWDNPVGFTGVGYLRLASLTKGSWLSFIGHGDSAGPCADRATFGTIMGETHLSRIEDPKFSIVWGLNPDVALIPRMRRIMEDKKKGGKVVVIDPRFTSTASRADEHIPIRPGTDGALALGMIRVIIEQGLQDEGFIVENTVGPLLVRLDNGLLLRESDLIQGGSQEKFIAFDKNTNRPQPCDTPGINPSLTGKYTVSGVECHPAYQLLSDMVKEYTPERVSEITDIPPDIIQRLAISYATRKPASIHRGYGLQRYFYGDLTCRAINTLAAITGNMKLQIAPSFVMNLYQLGMPEGPPKTLPIMLLYDAITKGEPTPVKAVFFSGHNHLLQLPDMNRMINEVFPHLELIVVAELFMTTTARYADYVLPVTSFLERIDLRTAGARNVLLNITGNTYLALQPKVIEPLYECKSNFQIAAELGRRMGFAEYFNKTEEQWIEEILASGHPTMEGITLEKLREGPVLLKATDIPHQFFTPTGRIEFYVERLKQFGQELPIYLEPVESVHSEKAKTYPLTLLTSHPKHRIHSTMANIPSLLRHDPEPTLEMNPVDAKSRNIDDQDVVSVFNDLGKVKLKVKLNPGIKPGVVNIDEGWWPEQFIEGHLNQLTHHMINPVHQFLYEPNASYCDVLVEVKRD